MYKVDVGVDVGWSGWSGSIVNSGSSGSIVIVD